MSWTHDLWAHLGTGLGLAAVVVPITKLHHRTPWVGGTLVLTLLGLTYLPMQNIDLGGYIYAITGPLSVSSVALLAGFLSRRLWNISLLTPMESRLLVLGVAVTTVWFYPLALGMTSFDPYALGYGRWPLLLAMLVTALAAWWSGYRRLGLLLLVTIWAFQLGVSESENIWDYLLDAWVAVYAILFLLFDGGRRLLSR